MESLFEQLGGTYTRQGDYCLPDVCLPPEEERPIGVYGQRRRVYLKKHHRILYYNLLTAGVLDGHLADIEEQAQELFLRLVEQYADTEGVTEALKADLPGIPYVFISSVTGQGITELKDILWEELNKEDNKVASLTHRNLDFSHRVKEEDELLLAGDDDDEEEESYEEYDWDE